MPFTPTDIAGLKHWASGDGGAFQDAAKAVPCTDGSLVYTWQNNGSTAADFIQATSGNRPVWNATGVNSKPYLTFSTDWLTSAAAAQASAVTFFLVCQCFSVTSGAGCIVCNNATTFQIAFLGATTGYIYNGGATPGWGSMPAYAQVLAVVFDGSSPFCEAWVKTTQSFTGQNIYTGTVPANLQLGGGSSGTYSFQGDFYEFLMYDTHLSSSNRGLVTTYLVDKYRAFPGDASSSQVSDLPGCYGNGVRMGDMNDELIQYGVRKDDTEGDPDPPCMALDTPGRFRFRWGVEAGSRSVSCRAKQVSNVTGKRPRIIVRANPTIGVNSDVIADAATGTGWVDLGPASITPTSNGVVWVELWNMDTDNFMSPAFFDEITTT